MGSKDRERHRAYQRAYSQTPRRRARVIEIAKTWRAKNQPRIAEYRKRRREARLKAKLVDSQQVDHPEDEPAQAERHKDRNER